MGNRSEKRVRGLPANFPFRMGSAPVAELPDVRTTLQPDMKKASSALQIAVDGTTGLLSLVSDKKVRKLEDSANSAVSIEIATDPTTSVAGEISQTDTKSTVRRSPRPTVRAAIDLFSRWRDDNKAGPKSRKSRPLSRSKTAAVAAIAAVTIPTTVAACTPSHNPVTSAVAGQAPMIDETARMAYDVVCWADTPYWELLQKAIWFNHGKINKVYGFNRCVGLVDGNPHFSVPKSEVAQLTPGSRLRDGTFYATSQSWAEADFGTPPYSVTFNNISSDEMPRAWRGDGAIFPENPVADAQKSGLPDGTQIGKFINRYGQQVELVIFPHKYKDQLIVNG